MGTGDEVEGGRPRLGWLPYVRLVTDALARDELTESHGEPEMALLCMKAKGDLDYTTGKEASTDEG